MSCTASALNKINKLSQVFVLPSQEYLILSPLSVAAVRCAADDGGSGSVTYLRAISSPSISRPADASHEFGGPSPAERGAEVGCLPGASSFQESPGQNILIYAHESAERLA